MPTELELIALETEFTLYLPFLKRLVLTLPDSRDRVRAAMWLQSLRQVKDDDHKKLRNEHLKLLLFALHRRSLVGVFEKPPPPEIESFHDGLTLLEMTREIIEITERKKTAGGDAEGEPGASPLPQVVTNLSADLKEYAAAQQIPKFGSHCYFAVSNEPIQMWQKPGSSIYPEMGALPNLLEWERAFAKIDDGVLMRQAAIDKAIEVAKAIEAGTMAEDEVEPAIDFSKKIEVVKCKAGGSFKWKKDSYLNIHQSPDMETCAVPPEDLTGQGKNQLELDEYAFSIMDLSLPGRQKVIVREPYYNGLPYDLAERRFHGVTDEIPREGWDEDDNSNDDTATSAGSSSCVDLFVRKSKDLQDNCNSNSNNNGNKVEFSGKNVDCSQLDATPSAKKEISGQFGGAFPTSAVSNGNFGQFGGASPASAVTNRNFGQFGGAVPTSAVTNGNCCDQLDGAVPTSAFTNGNFGQFGGAVPTSAFTNGDFGQFGGAVPTSAGTNRNFGKSGGAVPTSAVTNGNCCEQLSGTVPTSTVANGNCCEQLGGSVPTSTRNGNCKPKKNGKGKRLMAKNGNSRSNQNGNCCGQFGGMNSNGDPSPGVDQYIRQANQFDNSKLPKHLQQEYQMPQSYGYGCDQNATAGMTETQGYDVQIDIGNQSYQNQYNYGNATNGIQQYSNNTNYQPQYGGGQQQDWSPWGSTQNQQNYSQYSGGCCNQDDDYNLDDFNPQMMQSYDYSLNRSPPQDCNCCNDFLAPQEQSYQQQNGNKYSGGC